MAKNKFLNWGKSLKLQFHEKNDLVDFTISCAILFSKSILRLSWVCMTRKKWRLNRNHLGGQEASTELKCTLDFRVVEIWNFCPLKSKSACKVKDPWHGWAKSFGISLDVVHKTYLVQACLSYKTKICKQVTFTDFCRRLWEIQKENSVT